MVQRRLTGAADVMLTSAPDVGRGGVGGVREAADQERGSGLEAPPCVGRRELGQVTRLIMSSVPQVERQLVPQTNFLLNEAETAAPGQKQTNKKSSIFQYEHV